MRYSKEFKLECVRKYKHGEYIEHPPNMKKRDSFMGQVRNWVIIYNSLGDVGLENRKPTLDFHQRMELILKVENGESYNSTALSAGIGPDLLIRWHNIYLETGIDGLKSLKRGRSSMNKKTPIKKDDSKKTKEELLEELEYLRAENEYLKKLSALVQKRKAQQNKKK